MMITYPSQVAPVSVFLQECMCTVCTWTARAGIVVMRAWSNPRLKCCTRLCPLRTCSLSTLTAPRATTCTSVLSTRSRGVPIWPTSSRCCCGLTKTRTTGSWEASGSSVTPNKATQSKPCRSPRMENRTLCLFTNFKPTLSEEITY